MLLIVVPLLLLLAGGVKSLELISVGNAEVITEGRSGEPLELLFAISEENEESIVSNRSIVVCIIANNRVCSCNGGALQSLQLVWSSDCIEASLFDQKVSLSVQIQDENRQVILSTNEISIPVIPNLDSKQQMTLVLPLVLDDLDRAMILLQSLSHLSQINTVSELLVIVPARQELLIRQSLLGYSQTFLPLTVRVISEDSILPNAATYHGYFVQMALKLLVASIIQTDFYLTLDADIICLHPELLSYVIQLDGRAVYHHESIDIHPHWWYGSWEILGLKKEYMLSKFPNIGFHVTPAVLSSEGSRMTVNMIVEHMGSIHNWLSSSVVWSEYTLYCSALTYFGLFNNFHVESGDSSVYIERLGSNQPFLLHCYNVWYREQLPWDAVSAKNADNCLFSIVQSTTGVKPSLLLSAFSQLWNEL